MSGSGERSAFLRGARDGAPFLLVIVPFGMVAGVVGVEAGLTLGQIMGFSVLVIAGASQVAATQLIAEGAPVIVVLATALAINLRMAMYSAALAPHLAGLPRWRRGVLAYFLVDQVYATSALEYDRRPELSLSEKAAYFLGAAVPLCLPWYGSTWAGALLGTAMPSAIGLDFAVPIAFLAIVGPMLRTAAHRAAAAVSVALALALAGLPYNLGLLIAAAAAMATGAAVEGWMVRRGVWT